MTTTITIVGNVTSDPELRFTPSGAAVANFTVAVNERVLNKQTNEWEDGETTFYSCAAWRDMAEHVAESIQSGMRVIVVGGLKGRNFERQDGSKGTSLDVNVQEVGPSLRWATAKVTRAQRSGGNGGGQGNGGGSWGNQGGGQQAAPANDPWATSGAPAGGGAPANDPWATPGAGGDEPPF